MKSDVFFFAIFDLNKGQLISKCPFGVSFGPKYQRFFLWISALEVKSKKVPIQIIFK